MPLRSHQTELNASVSTESISPVSHRLVYVGIGIICGLIDIGDERNVVVYFTVLKSEVHEPRKLLLLKI